MGRVTPSLETLTEDCERLFAENGRLSTAIPGFVARPGQKALALAVAESIEKQDTLVAEAGTGTGKTFAYLVPALLSGQKTVISTATKTLQDQLFSKDLPLLLRALGMRSSVQNLKGRANYLCLYRIALHKSSGRFGSRNVASEVAFVSEQVARLVVGERGELPEIAEDSPVWPWVTSTTENCLGSECPHFNDCFLVKARRRALKADVVVINHHLFFADAELRAGGFGELLPGASAIIFDEAHQLPEVASHFQGERLGTRQVRGLFDDILREWPVLDAPNHPLQALKTELLDTVDALQDALRQGEEKIDFQEALKRNGVSESLQLLKDILERMHACMSEAGGEDAPGFLRTRERLEALQATLSRFLAPDNDAIRWVERLRESVVLHATAACGARGIQETFSRFHAAFVFTSATLAVSGNFENFLHKMGMQQVKTGVYPSPFDYQSQAMLYLPRALPDPKHRTFGERLVERTLPLVEALSGRSFYLFTSHRALSEAAAILRTRLKLPLLVQGEESKPILLERFRAYGNAVLLGTATFWEGVDVRGEALSCVIIDKLPFASPACPVMRGKMARVRAQNLSPFDTLALPEAIIALKQGVGRLIRDVTDRGVLVIADPRLAARDYGRLIFDSLPDMPKTRDAARVLRFINEVVLSQNETACD